MKAKEALSQLEAHKGGPIPVELIATVIGFLPEIFELISRKNLRRQVEAQGKLIQLILQKNTEQDAFLAELKLLIEAAKKEVAEQK